MFALISTIFALLFSPSTLPNGIRLVELPAGADSVEIVAGYTTGGLTGFAASSAAKSFMLDAYAVGATVDFIEEIDSGSGGVGIQHQRLGGGSRGETTQASRCVSGNDFN